MLSCKFCRCYEEKHCAGLFQLLASTVQKKNIFCPLLLAPIDSLWFWDSCLWDFYLHWMNEFEFVVSNLCQKCWSDLLPYVNLSLQNNKSSTQRSTSLLLYSLDIKYRCMLLDSLCMSYSWFHHWLRSCVDVRCKLLIHHLVNFRMICSFVLGM